MRGGFRLFVVLAPLMLAVDQLVKVWARTAASGAEGRTLSALWPGVFELKLVFNEGVAFGMLQGAGIFLAPVAIGIAAVSAWYSWRHPDDPVSHHVTAALLTAGALGNLVDRVTNGRVTDMFWIRLINFPVFNVADVCITVAGAMLVLAALRDLLRKGHPHEAEVATSSAPEP